MGDYLLNPEPAPSRLNHTKLLLDHNALQILEALYYHGSMPVYNGPDGVPAMYSEHAGVLTVHEGKIDQVITSTHAYRIDSWDNSIYLPCTTPDMYLHPYLFHTHPLNGTLGGRREVGIIYELPSPSDIHNFVYLAEHGRAQASIIVAPEGLYVIRKIRPDETVRLGESQLSKISDAITQIESRSSERIGDSDISHPMTFSRLVVEDTAAIQDLNTVLVPMGIWTEYYPRTYYQSGSCVLPEIYLRYYH